jgi:ketosteroid isomerase-like protein
VIDTNDTMFGQVVKAYNARDLPAFLDLVKNAVYTEVSTGETWMGDETVYRTWVDSFDMRVDIQRVIVQGDGWEVMESVMHGKHIGTYTVPTGSVAATGRELALPLLSILEAKDGQAIAIRHYYDLESMWSQLGARPT